MTVVVILMILKKSLYHLSLKMVSDSTKELGNSKPEHEVLVNRRVNTFVFAQS
jgi:hypothetical protein